MQRTAGFWTAERVAKARCEPLWFGKLLWPGVEFYREQRQVIESVRDNDETVVVAGNQLGKDFLAGFVCVWYFLCFHPARIVTTSVKSDHLRVLWGEIGRFIVTCAIPLDSRQGGPLILNHWDIKKRVKGGLACPISYLRGMVSEKGEGMAGHHAPFTLQVIDEASGVDDVVYTQGQTWAKKQLIFGNPNSTPPNHFFRRAVREGDIVAA